VGEARPRRCRPRNKVVRQEFRDLSSQGALLRRALRCRTKQRTRKHKEWDDGSSRPSWHEVETILASDSNQSCTANCNLIGPENFLKLARVESDLPSCPPDRWSTPPICCVHRRSLLSALSAGTLAIIPASFPVSPGGINS